MKGLLRLWHHSLRIRLLLPLLIGITLVGGVGAWSVYQLASRQLQEQLIHRANLYADSAYFSAESGDDLGDLQRHVNSLGAEREVKSIIVTAGNPARIIASSRRAWLNMPVATLPGKYYAAHLAHPAEDIHLDTEDKTILLVRQIRLSNPDLASLQLQAGTAMVELDASRIQADMAELKTMLLLALGLTFAAAAVLTYWLVSQRVVEPVARLAGVMRQRTHGDAAARSMATGQDEVGQLARTLNTMFDAQDKAEQALREAHASLANNAERLHLAAQVFENSQNAIIITDPGARIQAVNPAFSRMTGYAPDEVLGKTPRLLNSGREDDAAYAAMWESLNRTGHWQGELWNRRKNGEMFPEWLSISAVRCDAGEIGHYIGIGVDISERKDAEARIEHLAYYDALTDLPNRALASDRLGQVLAEAIRNGTEAALLFLDIDRFKNINDTLGHLAGDRLLQMTAQRLRNSVRAMDTVSRLGGDEFLVILPEASAEEAALVARKLIKQFQSPFDINGHQLTITISVGITIHPVDGSDAETLLKHADTAMYHAKESGRSRYSFFLPEMNERVQKRLELENHLHRAFEASEFALHYQPKVNLPDGRLVGAEALIRWRHPEWGMVPPNRFIPVAEESDLILNIGDWVITEVCRQLSAWRSAGLSLVPVAVNLSVKQFVQADFVARLHAILGNYDIPAALIELEVTESLFMQDSDHAVTILHHLRDLGFSLSLDDFGTGYSSLAYLKRMPLDKLKIDRAFVRDLANDADDAAIVRAVTQLGHTLGLRVIAEGVETSEQLDYLLAQHCDEAQGYLFSRPLPADEFAGHITADRIEASILQPTGA